MFFLRAKTRDPLGDRHLEFSSGPSVVIEFGDGDPRQTTTECALDVAQIALFIRRYECERFARHFRATCSSDSMYVVIGRKWNVEIHNVTKRFNVDPACSDVCRDKNGKSAALESSKRGGALKLRTIPVNPLCRDSVSYEIFGEAICAMLRAREHESLLDVSALEE